MTDQELQEVQKMRDAIAAIAPAMTDIYNSLQRWAANVLGAIRSFDQDVEDCYRAYAAQLNRGRRYRKLSWRRLNRHQRLEAMANFSRRPPTRPAH